MPGGVGRYEGRVQRGNPWVYRDLKIIKQFKWKGFISCNRAIQEMSE